MSGQVASQSIQYPHFEQLRRGKEIIQSEADALKHLASHLPLEFSDAVDCIMSCQGTVIVTGMGKAGWIGQKISATLASTGTVSHFMHPAEAIHGDLGRIQANDVILALSHSGATEEIVRLLPAFANAKVPVIAITSTAENPLGSAATICLPIGKLDEACSLGLAPSTSTTVMLALGDALALVVSELKGFQKENFAQFHPGGSLGVQLSHVDDQMRELSECRVAKDDVTVRDVIVKSSRSGRRTGAIMLVDAQDKLTGIFTDSDLARLLERNDQLGFDVPIGNVMTKSPRTVKSGVKLSVALEIFAKQKISELPVIDSNGHPIGLLDVTDLIGLL